MGRSEHFLHGSTAHLEPGTVLRPGANEGLTTDEAKAQAGHVYLSKSMSAVWNQWTRKHIYEVKAHGETEADPLGGEHDRRTRDKVTVVRRVGGYKKRSDKMPEWKS